MDKTTKAFLRLTKKDGSPAVSLMLGHLSTQRVERWFKKKHIPKIQIGMVERILRAKGELK